MADMDMVEFYCGDIDLADMVCGRYGINPPRVSCHNGNQIRAMQTYSGSRAHNKFA